MKSPIVVAETYEDYKRLVYQTARKFTDRFGGDFEENVADANVAFMRAYYAHKLGKARFSTLLVRCIWNYLATQRNSRYKEYTRGPKVRLDHAGKDGGSLSEEVPDKSHAYNFDSLTEDAKTVLDLVLWSPADIRMAVALRGGTPRNWQSVLRGYLEDLGWTRQRAAVAFAEIGRALSCV